MVVEDKVETIEDKTQKLQEGSHRMDSSGNYDSSG